MWSTADSVYPGTPISRLGAVVPRGRADMKEAGTQTFVPAGQSVIPRLARRDGWMPHAGEHLRPDCTLQEVASNEIPEVGRQAEYVCQEGRLWPYRYHPQLLTEWSLSGPDPESAPDDPEATHYAGAPAVLDS
jgi:hypothetical protein